MPAAEQATLPMPALGQLAVSVTTDEEAGVTRYVLKGPRLRGVMIVLPKAVGDELVPTGVTVSFGDGTAPVRPFQPRPDEPVAHGVRVHGTATCTIPDRLPDPRAVVVEGVVLGENYATRRVPDGAAALIEAAVVAVLTHWRDRGDRARLVLAAARRAVPAVAQTLQAALESAEAALTATDEERARRRRRLTQLEELAATAPPPTTPPTAAVRLPYTDHQGQALGLMLVREVAVNDPPGTVTYRVDGPRLAGSFVLGPYRNSVEAVPGGVSVGYGTGAQRAASRRHEEPVVNGIRVSGGWDHPTHHDIAPSAPRRLAVPSRAEPGRREQPVPEATTRRLWAIVRALAVHYAARPDIQALRLAAAHTRAAARRSAERHALAELEEKRAWQLHTIVRLRERLAAAETLMLTESACGPGESGYSGITDTLGGEHDDAVRAGRSRQDSARGIR